ncbi:MAG TPA: TIGR01244 family sulfur transferase [Stellaceae bacterium]|nr:TIGR01244 family sulfur transferase [Stellaceae bacterium]
MQPTPITDSLSVAGQITREDIAALAKEGYGTIINNRPDGEEPGQLGHEEAAAEAAKHGMEYHYIPVLTNTISVRDVVAHQKAVLRGGHKVLAHCRSGTRSYLLWAASRALYDRESALKLVAEGATKGFDLRVLPSLVEKLEAEKAG